MAVLIEQLKPEVERAGLTEKQLQTEVELRLRQAGIRVLTIEEREAVLGWPYLYVNAHILLRPDGLAVFHITVELCQKATLENGETMIGATTWKVARLGTIESANLSQLREDVRGMVDQFIKDYISINPRPAGSPAPAAPAPSPAPQPARRTR